jgi:hypothetical protein
VLDLFFVAPALDTRGLRALDGMESVHWIAPEDLDLDDIAFPSVRRAVEVFRSTRAAGARTDGR